MNAESRTQNPEPERSVSASQARSPRLPRLAVLLIFAVTVLKLFSQHFAAVAREDLWIPWLEVQTWAPLQRLVFGALLAAGAIITFRVALRQSSLFWPALVITLATVWVFPIDGSSAGFALCGVVLWACTRYVDGPGPEGFWLLTLLTALVSAVRLDFGVSVGIASLAALFARHLRDGMNVIARTTMGYVGALAVLTLLFVPLGQVQASSKGLGYRVTAVVARGSQVPERTFNVRWASGISESVRREREQQLTLVDGEEVQEDPSGRTWRYRWNRQSSRSILRLLNDPAVEDTQGIDRTSTRYVGTSGSPDTDLAWLNALLFGSTQAAFKAAAVASWLWVVLPIAGAIRVGRWTVRRATTDPRSRSDLIAVPALVLCLPIARLVVQDTDAVAAIAAPAFSALAVAAAWLISGPFVRQPSEATAGGWFAATHVRAVTSERTHHIYICAALAALTIFLHLSVNSDITNDHAAYLSMAQQIVLGYWPIRDFRDDGALLQILLSAAVLKIGGFRLLGEMLLSWTFLAAATCLTYWLAFRLTGKRLAAITAAVLSTTLLPRPYGYPKLFIYPLAILILWRYVDRPRTGRLVAVAATIALAFLFRIDHGVVIAATSFVAVAAVHAHELRHAVRQCLRLAAACLVFLSPQLAYVIWSAGLPRYLESVVTFGVFGLTNREPWPVSLSLQHGILTEANATTFLLNLSVLIAAIALVVSGSQIRRAWARGAAPSRESLWIFVVVVVWGLMLPMLARGQYYTRFAEVGEPVAILGAWLAVTWLSANPGSVKRWTALGAALTMIVAALCCRMPMAAFFRSPADVFAGMPFQARVLQDLATSPPIDAFAPKDKGTDFQKLVRWTRECTTEDDRLMVTWFAPEVYFYSGRAFAGDRWSYGRFDNTPERQRIVVERLRSQSVPIVLVNAERYSAEVEEVWPALGAYLNASYRWVARIPVQNDHVMGVLVSNSRIPSRYVPFLDLPCFD